MNVNCPTCGQQCLNEIRDNLDKQTLAIMSLFMSRGVKIAKGEARLLAAMRQKNRPISRSLLMDQIYGLQPDADCPNDKIIDVWVSKARRRIREAKLDWRIVTHWGLGYELEEDKAPQTLRRVTIGLGTCLLLAHPVLGRILS